MEAKIKCPMCGSAEVKVETIEASGELSFGKKYHYQEVEHHCQRCGEEGDFSDRNEENQKRAIEKAENELTRELIEGVSKDSGYSLSAIERAFELPFRSMAQWKAKGTSSAGLAFIKLLATYPWLVKVADHQFKQEFATAELIQQGVKALQELAHQKGYAMELEARNHQEMLSFLTTFTQRVEPKSQVEIFEANDWGVVSESNSNSQEDDLIVSVESA
jgi:predicted RNA-binding protein Jag